MDYVRQVQHRIRGDVVNYAQDFRRLFHGSPATFFFILITQLLLGALPAIEFLILGKFVDAMIGARAISVWTSAVTEFAWLQVGCMAAALHLVSISVRFEKLAGSVARRTFFVVFIASTYILAIPVAALQLLVILLIALVTRHLPSVAYHTLPAILIWVVAVHALFNLTSLTIHQFVTVGTMVTWGGCMLLLAFWFSMKPFLKTRLI